MEKKFRERDVHFLLRDLDHPMWNPVRYKSFEEAKEDLDRLYTNRNVGDGHDEYWRGRCTGIEKVVHESIILHHNKEKDSLEYYGDWMLSYMEDRDETYDYFDTTEGLVGRLIGLIKQGYDDIHVYKFNPQFGYEVIDNYLVEE